MNTNSQLAWAFSACAIEKLIYYGLGHAGESGRKIPVDWKIVDTEFCALRCYSLYELCHWIASTRLLSLELASIFNIEKEKPFHQ